MKTKKEDSNEISYSLHEKATETMTDKHDWPSVTLLYDCQHRQSCRLIGALYQPFEAEANQEILGLIFHAGIGG